MPDARFDLLQAIVVALFAGMGGAAIPLGSLDHWQKVVASFCVGACSGFSGSLAHDAVINRPAPAAPPTPEAP